MFQQALWVHGILKAPFSVDFGFFIYLHWAYKMRKSRVFFQAKAKFAFANFKILPRVVFLWPRDNKACFLVCLDRCQWMAFKRACLTWVFVTC